MQAIFPLWIAPVQVRILPITDAHIDYANKLQALLLTKNFRVECDASNAKINYKIREGTMGKIPYLLVVGDKEVEGGTVAVRSRKRGNEGTIAVEEFIRNIESEIREKR